MAIEGAALLIQTLEKLTQEKLYPIAQKELEIGEPLKKAPKIFKETGEIDFNQDAETINNLIRGLSPYPGAWCLGVFDPKDQSKNNTVFDKNKPFLIKILSAEIVTESLSPGEIKTDNKHYLIIGCKEKALKIQEIQVEGRKKCKSDEFLRGCQAFSLKIVQNEKK
jgi:methionyl-tRNA formyltransferase